MLNIKEQLRKDIQEGIDRAVKKRKLKIGKSFPAVIVEHPELEGCGDYASPIALALAKQAKTPPMEIVKAVVTHMPKKEYIGSVEAAEPGFINITLSEEWVADRLDDVAGEDLCSSINIGKGKLVNLEFISANPTGPLTLGNARAAFSADTLGNVLECAGYNVTREYYINDTGGQVRRLGESVLRRIIQLQGGTVDYPKDMYQGAYVREIARDIAEEWKETEGKEFRKSDLRDLEIVDMISDQAAKRCMTAIRDSIKKDLQIDIDAWTSEKELRASNIIELSLDKLRGRGLTYTKGGTEYLKTTKFGDDQDRVLVKKSGEYAYIAPDIGYHQNKYDREFDLIFTFLGADHQGHVPKLMAAMEALGNDTSKLHVVVAQWLTLLQGGKLVKLSKRQGTIVEPKDLIGEVGYDAARFFMVQHNLSSHMDFDIDLAKERNEHNPVFYVQYAYVRLQSILRKAKEQGLIASTEVPESLHGRPVISLHEEFDMIRTLYRWPETIQDIVESFNVHTLAYFAHDLAKEIHVYYKNVPVISAGDDRTVKSRLLEVFAARNVLGTTLDLLGISKPDVM